MFRIARRCISSNATFKPYQLPAEKLRSLISVYHQSATFITPENLSDRIDHAFATGYAANLLDFSVDYNQLETIRKDQRMRPKIGQWDIDAQPQNYGNDEWSNMLTAREARVIDALYGVDFSDKKHRLPGLESLEDEEANPAKKT